MKNHSRHGRIGMSLMFALGLFAADAEASSPSRTPIRPPSHIDVRPLVKARLPVQRIEIVEIAQLDQLMPEHCRLCDDTGRYFDLDDARLRVEGAREVTCEVLGTVHVRRNVRVPFEREPRQHKPSRHRYDKREAIMNAGFDGYVATALMPTTKELKKFGRSGGKKRR